MSFQIRELVNIKTGGIHQWNVFFISNWFICSTQMQANKPTGQ